MEQLSIVHQENKNLIDSRIVAQGLLVEHGSILKTIESLSQDFTDLSRERVFSPQSCVEKTGGRPGKYYLLSHREIAYLVARMRPSEATADFQMQLFDQLQSPQITVNISDHIIIEAINRKMNEIFGHDSDDDYTSTMYDIVHNIEYAVESGAETAMAKHLEGRKKKK